MQNENNNPSKQIILTNGSIITPIELNESDKIIRGQRRGKIIEWYDYSCDISKEELDEILAPFVVNDVDNNKLDSKGGK